MKSGPARDLLYEVEFDRAFLCELRIELVLVVPDLSAASFSQFFFPDFRSFFQLFVRLLQLYAHVA